MSINISQASFAPGPKYARKADYLHDLKELEQAKATDLIWIDQKGRVHCSGLFRQMLLKVQSLVNSLLGRVSYVPREVDANLLNRVLGLGKRKGWIDENKASAVQDQFTTYTKLHTDFKVGSVVYKIFLKFPQIQEEDAATARLRAAVRGWKTRQAVVKPSQILPKLKELLLATVVAPAELDAIAYGLCREINSISLEGKLKKGEGYKLDTNAQTYSIPIFEGNNWKRRKEVKFPFDCWVSLSKDGKSVDILFKAKEIIGSGTYKTYYKAQDFKFHLKLDNQTTPESKRRVDYAPATVFRSAQKDKESVLAGIDVQRTLLNIAKGKIVDTPVYPVGAKSESDLEMRQTWYNSDLHMASTTGAVPLDVGTKPKKREFSMEDCLQVVLDVAEALELIHKRGIIHRDVKGANILVKVDEDGKAKGYLADFDLVTTPGDSQKVTAEYQYWDKSCRKGWPLPLADSYGLAIAFAESIVPDFSTIRDHPNKLTASNLESEKAKAFKKLVSSKLNASENMLSEGESKLEFISAIDARLGVELSDDLRKKLITLKKEIVLVDFALTLAQRLIDDSSRVYEYLKAHPDTVAQLTGTNENARTKASGQILADSPYTTAAQAKEMLANLQLEFF